MKIANIHLPDSLIASIRDGSLVVFAGAGISMGAPANLPDFNTLARRVAEGTGRQNSDENPADRFLGELQSAGINIHNKAAQLLTRGDIAATPLHSDILRLYARVGKVRIVTTNLDLLFELAAENILQGVPEIHRAPALPLGRKFEGIVHVHGDVTRPEDMVLTDADFGRAYLIDGWARRFLLDLFQRYPVLFMGYSHEDVVLHYLARALPVENTQPRFALIPTTNDLDEETVRWRLLGIEPIPYPLAEGDHSALSVGVGKLADLVTRSVLDWRNELKEIALRPPPLDEEAIGIIDLAFQDEVTTRFFTKHACSEEWPAWLDKRKWLDALFQEGEFSKRDEVLSTWLARDYAVRCPDQVFALIGVHGMRLNRCFWENLVREVAGCKNIDALTLNKWVLVLLHTLGDHCYHSLLTWLGEQCAKMGQINSLRLIFEFMCRPKILLRQRLFFIEAPAEEHPCKVDIETPTGSDQYELDHLWEYLRSHLDIICSTLLPAMIGLLEQQHDAHQAWEKADQDWDVMCYSRSAIEPHEQDKFRHPADVVIDAARDCIEALLACQPTVASFWCDQLAISEAPLIRRIALHAIRLRTDLTAQEKLNWLFAHFELHDVSAHHEIYQLVRTIFPELDTKSHQEIINQVLAYQWDDPDDPDRAKRTARMHYDWFQWLVLADSECSLAMTEFERLSRENPEWAPREHPDLTHWTGSVEVGLKSEYSVDQLLAKPAKEWIGVVLDYTDSDPWGPSRKGLIENACEAGRQNFDWGLEFTSELVSRQEFPEEIWPNFIRMWTHAGLATGPFEKVLQLVEGARLYTRFPLAIAHLLVSFVQNEGKSYGNALFSPAEAIALEIWQGLEPDEHSPTANWLNEAINQPAGVLSEFWVDRISFWRSNTEPRPVKLEGVYLDVLEQIVQDDSANGRWGRAVLTRQLPFLLNLDEEWTKKRLLPFLSAGAAFDDFQSSWGGFLFSRLTPASADVIRDAMLYAAGRLNHELEHSKEHFIEFYTFMVMYEISDPTSNWIPALLANAGEAERGEFANCIGTQLRDTDETQQQECWNRWLRSYWQNRLRGIPVPLTGIEILKMLEWLQHLSAVFPDAVGLAVAMPPRGCEHMMLVYNLGHDASDIVHRFPEVTVELLNYLTRMDVPNYMWVGGEEIFVILDKANLDPHVKEEYDTLRARLGCDNDADERAAPEDD